MVMIHLPIAASSSDKVNVGGVMGLPPLPCGMCPGKVGSSSVVIEPNSRSSFPLPRGLPAIEWISWMCRSAHTWPMWVLVKPAPWSTYRVVGIPHTGQSGSFLRQIAWCRASAVCIADGSPRNAV